MSVIDMQASAVVLSVNLGRASPSEHTDVGVTGIDKRPVEGPVEVRAPGPKRGGLGSGLVGDDVCDSRHHGGHDQAVYAYAREDLDVWSARLGRPLPNGSFGENLTTSGLDVTSALIGERWKVGTALLEISSPRIPCRTFAGRIGEKGWIKSFTAAACPGAYLRVIEPGTIRGGDRLEVVLRPAHQVTVGIAFRAFTLEPELLPLLFDVESLQEEARALVRRRVAAASDSSGP